MNDKLKSAENTIHFIQKEHERVLHGLHMEIERLQQKCSGKVHIFWEGHKIFLNLHQLFDWQYLGQIIGGDFIKFCGLLRIYEL